MGENPHLSLAWDEGPVQGAFDGMARKRNHRPMSVRTKGPKRRFLEEEDATQRHKGSHQACNKTVPGHPQTPASPWRNEVPRQVDEHLSELAGGYTPQFATAIRDGAEELFEVDREEVEVLAEGPEVSEEEHELVDEEVDPEEEDGELEEKDEKWKKIQRVHHRLGHPANKTPVRMLALGGASKDLAERASCLSVRSVKRPPCQLGN